MTHQNTYVESSCFQVVSETAAEPVDTFGNSACEPHGLDTRKLLNGTCNDKFVQQYLITDPSGCIWKLSCTTCEKKRVAPEGTALKVIGRVRYMESVVGMHLCRTDTVEDIRR
jgi:hypothetical protein